MRIWQGGGSCDVRLHHMRLTADEIGEVLNFPRSTMARTFEGGGA